MKYLISTLCLLFVLPGCGSPSDNEMLLSGEVKGLKKGTLLLQKLEDTLFISVDSMIVDGLSVFNFSDEIISPEMYYLTLTFHDSSNLVNRLPFFAEPGKINIQTTLKDYESKAVITGSRNQEKIDEYNSLMKRYNDQNLDLIEQGFTARMAGKDSLSGELQSQQRRLLKLKYLATLNFAKNNNDLEVAPYLMLAKVYDVNVTYLDTIYNSLTPKIKDSKYGKALESLIKSRNK
jgi:uncharacterized protein DUF4369